MNWHFKLTIHIIILALSAIASAQTCSFDVFIQNPETNRKKSLYREQIEQNKLFIENNNSILQEDKAQKLFQIGACYLKLGNTDSTLGYYSKAAKYYRLAANYEKEYLMNNGITYIYVLNGFYDSAIYRFKDQLELIRNAGNKSNEILKLCDLIKCHLLNNDYNEASENIREALDLSTQIKDSATIGILYYHIANFFYENKNYVSAKKYFIKGIDSFNSNKNPLYLDILIKLSITESNLGNETNAFRNSKDAIQIAEKNNMQHYIAKGYAALGQAYKSMGLLDSAICMYLFALETGCDACPEVHFLPQINDLGNLYMLKKEFSKAGQMYGIGYKIAFSANSFKEIVLSELYLGKSFFEQNKMNEALKWFQESYKTALKYNYSETLKETAAYLSNIYFQLGNTARAYHYKLEQAKYLEEFLTDQNKKWTSEFEFRIDLDEYINKKEKEWLLAESESKAKLRQQKTIKNSAVLFAILFASFGIYFFINYRKKQKANTLLHNKNIEIERISNELREADKMKLRFFSNVSHEFRTPLTLILNPVEKILKSFKGDNNQKKQLRHIYNNANRLRELTNQILDLQKLDAGKLSLHPEKADIVKYFLVICASFESICQNKNNIIRFKSQYKSAIASFDKDKIGKIISNLLSNALKFCFENTTIEVILEINENIIHLFVINRGIGIPGKNISQVFKRYYQDATSAISEGTGIGLAYVKELAEFMNGNVLIESVLNEETKVQVQIPLDEIEIINSAQIEIKIPKTGKTTDSNNFILEEVEKNKKHENSILIVEDNDELRDYISDLLKPEYNLYLAKDGNEGIQAAFHNMPDIIISDVMMPNTDGYELCKKLKEDERSSHIPVILITAKAQQKDRLTGYQYGADDYIAKPFNDEELKLKVQNLLLTRKRFREKFKKNFSINPTNVEALSLDEQFLLKVAKVVENNISNSGFTVEELCHEIGMSRRNLYGKLIALTDINPSQFIRTIRLKRAAQLITQKAGSISEIAFQTGFESTSYFTKCFKETFKKLPSEYSE